MVNMWCLHYEYLGGSHSKNSWWLEYLPPVHKFSLCSLNLVDHDQWKPIAQLGIPLHILLPFANVLLSAYGPLWGFPTFAFTGGTCIFLLNADIA